MSKIFLILNKSPYNKRKFSLGFSSHVHYCILTSAMSRPLIWFNDISGGRSFAIASITCWHLTPSLIDPDDHTPLLFPGNSCFVNPSYRADNMDELHCLMDTRSFSINPDSFKIKFALERTKERRKENSISFDVYMITWYELLPSSDVTMDIFEKKHQNLKIKLSLLNQHFIQDHAYLIF